MQNQQKEKIEKTHLQEEQMQGNEAQITQGETGRQKMITQLNKNQFKHPEMQGNEVQNKRRESETSKMLVRQDRMSKMQLQTRYMQSNKSQVMRGEKGKKIQVRQDRIIENQSHRGEMMIKNKQNKKENAKNESMLSEQYIHKKSIIQTQSQSGRSMVEMLGVLAIIGVLSIGGITGYKYAMNYYQANQIAHEMNIMRTDARIKIAQGAEELVLGNPYDDGNINFNNYETDFDCALADDAIIEENVSCRVANAFYIEMKNISQEICRPLSKLIQGMNELIGFEITTETIEADNEECQEGANNIHAVFSAEAISELKSCEENTDCEELENTPYCDKTRHVCVKCYEDKQCAHTEYCEDNTCKSCDEGLVWNGEKCVECTENDDCADISETPVCNTDINKCVECTESTECPETLVCRNNECTTCETEAECQAKGENYHCSNTSTCIQCASNLFWDSNRLRCVECLRNENCFEKDTKKPVCNIEQGICEPCANEGEAWNEEQQKCAPVVCKTNAECFEHLDQNYYCDKTPVNSCGENETGTCKKFELDLHGPVNGVSIDASAKIAVTYWNGCRICEANAGQDGARCSDNSYLSPYMLTPDFLDCADKYDPSTFYGAWYCHERVAGNRYFDKDNVSHNIQDLRALLGCSRLPEENKDTCNAALNLAVYNKDYPCSSFRIGLDDNPSQVGWGFGDMTWCDAVALGGKKHPHGGIICKKH